MFKAFLDLRYEVRAVNGRSKYKALP